jgi:uncharacterized protein (TIGR02147 family)
MNDWRPDIFGYLDYRAYLKDVYEAGKAHTRHFSYRYLSQKAGFRSPNFIKLVIDSQRNLSAESIEPVAKAFGLRADERRFFADLVAFDQASTVAEKNEAFSRLCASRRFREARRLDHSMFAYLSCWYYPAVREMAARPDFRPEPEWISGEVFPPITAEQAAEALDLLFELGLLVRDASGRVLRGEPSVTTGHEVRSLAIGNYHRQMLERAAESIVDVPRQWRDISALTICVSRDQVAALKERIHGFRESLLDTGDRDERPEVVYQLNIQLFPLTKFDEES